jgi:YVTN family beta-propeller protein
MKTMKKLLFLTFATVLFISCSNDDDSQPGPNPPEAYEKGIFVTNEGPFGAGTGNVTYISEDFTDVQQHIFLTVNGKDLGNIVQSMNFQDENAYIVVNNSQKIEVVNRYSFESVDSIKTGINNPRYFLGTDNNKGYVTNWGDPNDNSDDFVSVVDLRSNAVSATIPVSFGPEKMVSSGNKIYVAHQGGFGQNNLVSVISGNTVESTINVGDVPNSMVVSGNSLFVLCGGNPSYTGNETAGSLVKIDLSNGQVSNTYNLAITQHPTGLTIDGSNLYYNLDGKVYKVNSTSISLPGAEIINGFFYALEAHNGKLYATDAGDFASNGSLKIFDLSTNQQIQEFQTGIIPGGIYFND